MFEYFASERPCIPPVGQLTYPAGLLLIIVLMSVCTDSYAQQRFEGYFRHETGVALEEDGDFLFSRNIIQNDLILNTNDWQLTVALQLRQDLTDSDLLRPDFRLREAYAEWFTDEFDFRIGRQMLAWGRSEGTIATDFFTPVDMSEFLTQDLTDLRQGITAANLQYYSGANTWQFLVIPIFESSSLPRPGSRWDFFPDIELTFDGHDRPGPAAVNIQTGLFWSNRTRIDTDIDAGVFLGFHPLPALSKELVLGEFSIPSELRVRYTYPRTPVFLLSAEHRVTPSTAIQFESAYRTNARFDILFETADNGTPTPISDFLDTIEQYNENGFLASSPHLYVMGGIRSTIFSWQTTLQYQADIITDYQSDMLPDPVFHALNLSAARTFRNDLLQTRLITRYHINGQDIWINPDFTYSLLDGIRLSAGGHFFYGSEPDPTYGHLSFNRYRKNSFAYLKLTAWW